MELKIIEKIYIYAEFVFKLPVYKFFILNEAMITFNAFQSFSMT